jgi:hypothetical protein
LRPAVVVVPIPIEVEFITLLPTVILPAVTAPEEVTLRYRLTASYGLYFINVQNTHRSFLGIYQYFMV